MDKKKKQKKALEFTVVEEKKAPDIQKKQDIKVNQTVISEHPLLKFDRENLLQGIVLGEILNVPKGRRRFR